MIIQVRSCGAALGGLSRMKIGRPICLIRTEAAIFMGEKRGLAYRIFIGENNLRDFEKVLDSFIIIGYT